MTAKKMTPTNLYVKAKKKMSDMRFDIWQDLHNCKTEEQRKNQEHRIEEIHWCLELWENLFDVACNERVMTPTDPRFLYFYEILIRGTILMPRFYAIELFSLSSLKVLAYREPQTWGMIKKNCEPRVWEDVTKLVGQLPYELSSSFYYLKKASKFPDVLKKALEALKLDENELLNKKEGINDQG